LFNAIQWRSEAVSSSVDHKSGTISTPQICLLEFKNLENRHKTDIFDMVRRIALKQQKFSKSDPVLIRQLKKCSPIQT